MKKILALFAVLLLAAVVLTAGCTIIHIQIQTQTPAADENDPITGEWVVNGYYIDEANDKAVVLVMTINADNTLVTTEYLYQENSGDAQYAAENVICTYPGTWTKNSDGIYTFSYETLDEVTAALKDNVITDSDGYTYEKKTAV